MQTQVTRQEELEERETLKRERFWNFFTMTTACTYGIAIVMLGCSFYLADIFISHEGATTISAVWKQFNGCIISVLSRNDFLALQWFNDYLCIVGITLLIWLQWDIRSYLRMVEEFTRKNKVCTLTKDPEIFIR